jgi:hypothetical protein
LGVSVSYLARNPKPQSLHARFTKVFSLGTNKHAYCVFNKTTGCVETTIDVKFDELNGSQREQVSENLVDDEEPPSVSIFRMGTSEVMPCEVQVQAPVDTSN